jgi:hypothetical protein
MVSDDNFSAGTAKNCCLNVLSLVRFTAIVHLDIQTKSSMGSFSSQEQTMSVIHRQLQQVRSRQQRLWLVNCASWGFLFAATVSLLYCVSQLWRHDAPSAIGLLGLLLAGPIVGSLIAVVRGCDFHQAAVAVDAHYGLKDRASTALAFIEKADRRAISQLQLDDTERHLSQVDATAVAPWITPNTIPWAAALTIASIVLLAVSVPPSPVAAAVVTNEVILTQAERAADQIDLLREFNQEDPNPELEQLIEKLAAKVEELQQPGVDAKEALAKLSEMQAALQEQQQQLEKASSEAALQAIGDALSNAGSMSAAGSALTSGNYAKASEELDKIEQPPVLDRQTVRTVTEKLEQAKEKMDAAKLQNLGEATENLAQGLASGNGSKFSDGSRGLSGEAKKQGRRKKLSDLLRQQNQALDESKSETECDNNGGSSKAKGGNNWGRGASGGEKGDKTSSLGSSRQMQISGQEGDEGDVDTESSHSPERRERAQRGYRERFDQSQKLNDSVLDSEPIPLGHRQTIRRYFEMIRPQQSEVDQVKDAVQPPAVE